MRKGNGIFISYRRADAGGHAGRLFDWLDRKRGRRHVFMDVAGIDAGSNFELLIDAALRRCHVVLAVIGPAWAASFAARGTGVDDWLRRELERALDIELRVVPVLVGGATMPAAAQLPPSLAPLASLNAIDLRDGKWASDCELLWRAVKPPSQWYLTRQRVAAGMLAVAAVLLCVLGVLFLDTYGLLPRGLGGSPHAAAPAVPEPEAYAQAHGTSPLVVRSLLAVLRDHQVPAAQVTPRLDRLADLHRAIDGAFRDPGSYAFDGPASRRAAAARKEMHAAWTTAARAFSEGRFDDARTALTAAAAQLLAGASERATAQDAAIVHWMLGNIERLTLAPAAAADDYRLALQWTVAPVGRGGLGPLALPVQQAWADLLFEQADFAAAESHYREALVLAQRAQRGIEAVEMLRGIAASLEARQRYADAVPVRAQALDLWTRDGIKPGYFTNERVHEYAETLHKAGRDAEARALLERFALAPRKGAG